MEFEFKVVSQGQGALLPKGLHNVIVSGCAIVMSSTKTPQVEVTFTGTVGENRGLIRKRWYNLVGYRKNDSGQYLAKNNRVINIEGLEGEELQEALNKRVVDAKASSQCMEILGKFAGHCGFDSGRTLNQDTIQELLDSEVLLAVVPNNRGADSAQNTYSINSVDYAEEKTSEYLGYEINVNDSEVETFV